MISFSKALNFNSIFGGLTALFIFLRITELQCFITHLIKAARIYDFMRYNIRPPAIKKEDSMSKRQKKKNKAVVKNMSIYEYDEELHIKTMMNIYLLYL